MGINLKFEKDNLVIFRNAPRWACIR